MSGRWCLEEQGPLIAQQTGTVTVLLDRLFPLWTQPVGTRDNAEADFREVYTDPVMMNGIATPAAGPVRRGRPQSKAFELSVGPDYFVRPAFPHTPNASP